MDLIEVFIRNSLPCGFICILNKLSEHYIETFLHIFKTHMPTFGQNTKEYYLNRKIY